jgi:excisionase family DNA binding protein
MTERMAYSVTEVGELLGVSLPTIYARIKDGSLRSSKFGRRRLILRADVEALFDQAEDGRGYD